MNNYRKLNEEEKQILIKISNRELRGTPFSIDLNTVDAIEVAYDRDNNFTYCTLLRRDNNLTIVRAAKRNPRDRDNPRVGELIAFGRTLKAK